MNKENQLYKIVWTQAYQSWAKPEVPQEQEIETEDLSEAQAVLARIMAK